MNAVFRIVQNHDEWNSFRRF